MALYGGRRTTRPPAALNLVFFPPAEWLLSAARRLAPTVKLMVKLMGGRPLHAPCVPVVCKGVVVTGDAFVGDSVQRDEMRWLLKRHQRFKIEGAVASQASTQFGGPRSS